MTDSSLRLELLRMRDQDVALRNELMAANRLGGPYVPEMEAVHVANAARLRELVALHGWPDRESAGDDGAEAAWFIVQHAVGERDFQRAMLVLLRRAAQQQRIPAWHAAYLEDRIAMQEGRPQRFGTQWLDDAEDGRVRPWTLEDPLRVDISRAEVGLKPLAPIPDRGPALPPAQQREIRESRAWWLNWLTSKGWMPREPPTEGGSR